MSNSIRIAADGLEAVKVISEWPPALLLTDLKDAEHGWGGVDPPCGTQ